MGDDSADDGQSVPWFRKFSRSESVASQSAVKASVARGIRAKIVEQYGEDIEPVLEAVMPKKGSFEVLKCHGHITMIAVDKQLLFFQEWDGPWFPTLRLVHRFPNLLPRLQVDKGAIKFVLSGANIMSPGLTSPGADLGEAEVEAGQPVTIMAEGKSNALAIGRTLLSTSDIKRINKGVGVDLIHYLNDGLWNLEK